MNTTMLTMQIMHVITMVIVACMHKVTHRSGVSNVAPFEIKQSSTDTCPFTAAQ